MTPAPEYDPFAQLFGAHRGEPTHIRDERMRLEREAAEHERLKAERKEYKRLKREAEALKRAPGANLNIHTTKGSMTMVVAGGPVALLKIGAKVSGPGIAAGTTIVGLDNDNHSITLSTPAYASYSGPCKALTPNAETPANPPGVNVRGWAPPGTSIPTPSSISMAGASLVAQQYDEQLLKAIMGPSPLLGLMGVSGPGIPVHNGKPPDVFSSYPIIPKKRNRLRKSKP